MAAESQCSTDSNSYMLLNPEKVSLVDLYHILFSNELEKKNFVDISEGSEHHLNDRWTLLLSVAAQKFLQFVSKPLAWIGQMTEFTLNLFSCNDNLGKLLLNAVRGEVVIPDKISQNYLSFTGHTDKRMELEKIPEHVDGRYYALLSVMAAKASYENAAYIENIVQNHWKMELLGSFDFWNDYQEKNTTQAFMLHDKTSDPDLVVVAFRGTETFDADAWCSDFDLSWYELPVMGKIHGGFMKALGLIKNEGWPKETERDQVLAYYFIRNKLREFVNENKNTKFLITGHSLGGALAILFPAILAFHGETEILHRIAGIYTFGQPRVGDAKFGEFMINELKSYDIPYFRFVYCNDIVPRLPYDNSAMMYKHFGTCLYFNSLYEGKICEEEPNKNYFSLIWMIPMKLNCIWEIIRSHIIPYMKGPDYREGWFLKIFRLMGLFVAGLPAHMPQDYVTSTRLGSTDLYLSRQDQTNSMGIPIHQYILITRDLEESSED